MGRVAKIFIFAKIPGGGGGGSRGFLGKISRGTTSFWVLLHFCKQKFSWGNLFLPPSPILNVCIYAVNQFWKFLDTQASSSSSIINHLNVGLAIRFKKNCVFKFDSLNYRSWVRIAKVAVLTFLCAFLVFLLLFFPEEKFDLNLITVDQYKDFQFDIDNLYQTTNKGPFAKILDVTIQVLISSKSSSTIT